MATIITVLSLLKDATKVTKKVFPNADLDTFINELDSALKSPAALKNAYRVHKRKNKWSDG